jgi:hypothetical protein
MGTDEAAGDDRAERTARMDAARERAARAGDRVARLRADQLDARQLQGTVRGSSAEDVADSRRLATEAEDHLVRAFERGALAHDRAARQHEQQAAEQQAAGQQAAGQQAAGQQAGGQQAAAQQAAVGRTDHEQDARDGSDHLVRAEEHRQAAAADRDRATAARNRRDAPTV